MLLMPFLVEETLLRNTKLEQSLETYYLTKLITSSLYVCRFLLCKEIWLSATFVIQFLTQRELCFVETLSPGI
jgi:hypothetical protein